MSRFAIVPDSKPYEFPGKRPANLEHFEDDRVQAGEPLPCTTCTAYGVGSQECPLVETRKCADHGEYNVRRKFPVPFLVCLMKIADWYNCSWIRKLRE